MNQLARYEGNQALSLQETLTLGDVLAKSGLFQDARQAAQAVAKIMAGAELGFPPLVSMTGVYVVKGRITLSANLIAAAIKRSEHYSYRVPYLEDDGCEIAFFEDGQEVGRSRFDQKDAQKAGLHNGDNWKKYPRNMYFARALSNGAKWYCPDIFGGPIYTPDELGARIDGETGEVIDVEVSSVPQEPREDDIPAKPANGNGNGHVVEAADDATLKMILSTYRQFYPNSRASDQTLLDTLFARACDGDTTRSADNAENVLAALALAIDEKQRAANGQEVERVG